MTLVKTVFENEMKILFHETIESEETGPYLIEFKCWNASFQHMGGVWSVEDIDFEGSLKFDGCMNFIGGENTMVHICGPSDWKGFQKVIDFLYAKAKELWGDLAS